MTSKLQEKPLGLLREHPALQNKIFSLFLVLWYFCYYNPEPDLADKKLNAALRIRIHKTVYKYVIPVQEFLGNL
jgi:hypothetical protein